MSSHGTQGTPITTRPILFLDIDGVLVTQESTHINGAKRIFCKNAFGLLRQLAVKSACDIVISSTWRIGGSVAGFQATFEREGWPDAPVIGLTPVCAGKSRGHEVALWLQLNKHFRTPYVILDDDTDFLSDQPLVRTDFRKGFTETEYQACLAILLNNNTLQRMG